jgi:hypothetical protein
VILSNWIQMSNVSVATRQPGRAYQQKARLHAKKISAK